MTTTANHHYFSSKQHQLAWGGASTVTTAGIGLFFFVTTVQGDYESRSIRDALCKFYK
jgi:hypothetical protein